MEDGLDPVALRILEERRVVVRMVVRSKSGVTGHAPARSTPGLEEGADPLRRRGTEAPVPPRVRRGNLEGSDVNLALDTLYQRTLLRDPTTQEKAHLKQLYRDIEATGKPDPAKAWMILSCFTVTTSVEFLFY